MIRGALVVGALVLLSGCSGNRANPGAQPSTISDAEILAIGKQLAECARNNGVPDFPDPYVEKGKLRFSAEVEQALQGRYSQQVLDQAEQACKSIMDRLPESAIRSDSGEADDPQQDVETMKKLAQCMRDNGIPEWPDPKADGSFPVAGTPLDAEGKSERVLAAGEKCKQYWTGSIRYSS